jgi:hypothetical protein
MVMATVMELVTATTLAMGMVAAKATVIATATAMVQQRDG